MATSAIPATDGASSRSALALDSSARSDRSGRIVVPALIASVALALGAYVHACAPLIPICDAWSWIAQAKAWSEGGFAGWWSEHPMVHTQHVYALPAAIALVLGPLVDYSMRPFAFATTALLVGTGLLLYRIARAAGLGRYGALVAFLAAASFRHHENLVFGFQIGVVGCVFFGVAAVAIADRRRDALGLALSGGCAVASFACSSAGLLSLVAVIAVRWIDPRRVRLLGVLALAAVALVLALHFAMLWAYQRSFVSEGLALASWQELPRIARNFVRLSGGALVGGEGATPAGLAISAFAIGHLLARTRFAERVDAQAGLVIFGLLTTLTIAVARSPMDLPESRHAVFGVPLVAGAAIEAVRSFAARARGLATGAGGLATGAAGLATGAAGLASARTRVVSAVAVVALWLQADACVDAIAFYRRIAPWELDTRLYTAAIAGDGKLKAAEIHEVNPGETERIRALMQYVRDAKLTIFSPSYRGIAVWSGLPTRKNHDGLATAMEEGELRSTGCGFVYERSTCPFASGGTARLSVDLAVRGHANIGFIVRNASKGKEVNVANPVRAAGEGFAVHTIRAEVEPGDEVDAYVYTASGSDSVRIRSFSTVLAQRSQVP